jgi:hypothetical protein
MNIFVKSSTDNRETKDLRILALFTQVYCKHHHAGRALVKAELDVPATESYRFCAECAELLTYAGARRRRCPLDPKPTCKHCPVHCYRPGQREKIREIMRFAGKNLLRRGRLDLLWHYFF